jgi:hypothetical protein
MEAAPATPIKATDDAAMTIDPVAAPSEKPTYMNEAFKERAMGA